ESVRAYGGTSQRAPATTTGLRTSGGGVRMATRKLRPAAGARIVDVRPGDETGRHAALRMLCFAACGFESRPGHPAPPPSFRPSPAPKLQLLLRNVPDIENG